MIGNLVTYTGAYVVVDQTVRETEKDSEKTKGEKGREGREMSRLSCS